MNSELDSLLKKAAQHVMTPMEIYEQRVSWIYGEINMKRSDNNLISEEVIREVLKQYGIFPPCPSK